MAGTATNITGQRIRRGKGIEHIRREALQDTRISFKAQGILTYLLSLPDNWKTNAERLATLRDTKGKVKEGRESIQAGLRELEAAGYLRRERKSVAGRWVWHWTYSDDPDDLLDHTMNGLPVNGSDQAKHPVSAAHTIDGLAVDGSPVDIERRDQRDLEEFKDSSDDGAVAPPPPAAGAQPQDDELAIARIERHLTWIESDLSGFEPGEEPIAASMLEREEPTRKILNTLKKRRRAPIEQKARIGQRLGGYQDGEEDVVDYLMYCKYSEDVIAASMLRDRQNGVQWAS